MSAAFLAMKSPHENDALPASTVRDAVAASPHEADREPSPCSPGDAPDAWLVGGEKSKEDEELLDVLSAKQHKRRRLRRVAFVAGIVAFAVAAFAVAMTIIKLTHPPLGPDAFRYKSYNEIVESLEALEAAYPQFVEVFTAQERYGLPLRDELMCTGVNNTKVHCQHYVVKITDRATLPDPERPEIFFSGALHGDERVGPQAALALAEILAQNAADEENGIEWLQRLVKTRTVVIMPTTNAYGYDQDEREERSVDPNRDFPYLKKGDDCFQTMVARAVNEVWRAHLFQLSVTWHGGTTSISYEWGGENHVLRQVYGEEAGGSEVSPDDVGQTLVAKGMSRFGGKFEDREAYYPTGRQNDIVYAVEGGMEDWGYAASWENPTTLRPPIGVCTPDTLGGYDASKSVYNNATHRAFNILIETSDDKSPSEWELGDHASLTEQALADFLPSNVTIGHVPRNVRLALFYIDILQPYVVWKSSPVNVTVQNATEFTWEVAGAITVNSTQLQYSTSPDMANATTTESQSGVTRWYHPDMRLTLPTSTNKGLFTQSLQFPRAGVYYVQASAVVDQNWAEQPEVPMPKVKPQTHIVNARTNPDWFFETNNKTVQGKLEWTSPIVKVIVE